MSGRAGIGIGIGFWESMRWGIDKNLANEELWKWYPEKRKWKGKGKSCGSGRLREAQKKKSAQQYTTNGLLVFITLFFSAALY